MRVGDEDEDEGKGEEGEAAASNELLLLLLRAGLNRNKALGFATGSAVMRSATGITSGSATNDTRYLMELGVGDLDPATAERCGDLPVEELCDPLSS